MPAGYPPGLLNDELKVLSPTRDVGIQRVDDDDVYVAGVSVERPESAGPV